MVRVKLERSVSSSGRHEELKIAYVVSRSGVRPLRIGPGAKPTKPTYARGSAYEMEVSLSEGEYLVAIRLNRNFLGMLKGEIRVIDWRGREVLRLVLRKRKLRLSEGDPSLAWTAWAALKAAGLDKLVRKSQVNNLTDIEASS
ncbi:hypothetical protein APE_0202.1 [Aeropyrum pernix K1]|uniref:Uncharacterized protein n=1 Tax=Aeropyrum pernix (strain ATCC 700893 / DSM 11879 / JCM 9820 / NBRC 100138 / K1) TaxID=272557 RepID=Q9YFP7_AERPE|nr:hypothetical protein [Aeropyrum pernix]BAA79114.2 hypothetical protein APE_0202.1 [Aeropyrum pernix K1]